MEVVVGVVLSDSIAWEMRLLADSFGKKHVINHAKTYRFLISWKSKARSQQLYLKLSLAEPQFNTWVVEG